MVGVPGKYKGCETCRRRRVKCSNERPFCQTCTNSRRTCEGYEREMVFITGTPAGKGRVASHPKRSTPPKTSSSLIVKVETERGSKSPRSSKSPRGSKSPHTIRTPLLSSAWDEPLELSGDGADFSALLTTLHTGLHTLVRNKDGESDDDEFGISFAPYSPPDLHSVPDTGLWVNAQCLLCHRGIQGGDTTPESYCVFLFQQTSPHSQWTTASDGLIKGLGPSHFSSFPNHHFFVRVHRPMAMCLALLGRRDTFLAKTEWMTIPWTTHSKSQLDILFDSILMLPSLLAETDQLTLQPPTSDRRHKLVELLHHCSVLENAFNAWFENQKPFEMWTEQTPSTEGGIPFESAFVFRDEFTALKFLYYWMAQLVFHRCFESVYGLYFEQTIDFNDNWPELPQSLPNSPGKYQDCRALAENICRTLDCVLVNTTQPDMLVGPMTIAMDYYRELQLNTRDGALESIWLEAVAISMAAGLPLRIFVSSLANSEHRDFHITERTALYN